MESLDKYSVDELTAKIQVYENVIEAIKNEIDRREEMHIFRMEE